MPHEQIPQQEDLARDQGEINFAAIGARTAELASLGWDQAKIALHGLSAAVHNRLMERAGSRMERIDHKEALYLDLGAEAVNGFRPETETATGEPAMPRSRTERRVASDLDEKSQKHMVDEIYAWRATKNYGHRDALPGLNKKERKQLRREQKGQYRSGQLTARELRLAVNDIDAQPSKIGEPVHKKISKDLEESEKKLDRAIRQPVSSRWRARRYRRSINAIQTHHYATESHRQKADGIRQQRRNQSPPTTI